ncbi:MAG: CapA family protein [Bacteroidetes bacterium]|nr:CapA family protein [Bacteroidota bacterium]
MNTHSNISLIIFGDISFKGKNENKISRIFNQDIESLFAKTDFVVANLESPLITKTSIPIPGKCTLHGDMKWAAFLKKSGLHLVTLANNHMMDYGKEGLFSTIEALGRVDIDYVGAGKDIEAACQPLYKKIDGKRVAFLGRCSVEVSSQCYAGVGQPGVAFLDKDEVVQTIIQCRDKADLIVLMIHWGMEHYQYPSIQQRLLAEELVSVGADIILGHHPHVLQGEEYINGALVSYSSGNFLFDDFPWTITLEDGTVKEFQLILSEKNRQGMMLEVCIDNQNKITTKQVFTRITEDATVEINNTPARHKEYKKLCSRLHMPVFGFFWKIYSIKQEWNLRIKHQLSLGHIIRSFHKIRPRHFKELYIKFRRSSRVTSGKSTNPYEG